jgi:hypothetical protein
METIEHGVPAVFADPKVLNFDKFGKFEAVPGYTYPTLPGSPNKSIRDGFYEGPRASLGKEVPLFGKQLDTDAQFVTGAFPAVVGAPANRDRSTAKEYEMSRQIALQRLQIAWQYFVDWFKETIESGVRMYSETVVEDEKFVKSENGNYVNVWIRREELSGKVGGCESEASEGFPTSLAQKQAIIKSLMEMNNDFINAALYTPENAAEIQQSLTLGELKLPGSDQRLKQCLEFKELVKSEPEDTGQAGPDGQPIYNSSVPIEPDVDDDAVHIAVCRSMLVSPEGQDLKRINPGGYLNTFWHMKTHIMHLQSLTAKPNMTPPGTPPPTAHHGIE